MAGVRISSLPAHTAPIGSDVLPVVNAGETKKLSLSDLSSCFASGISVKSYGAVGDGSHDDTAAIQDAIDAAETAGGGAIYFPVGTYMITAPVTVSEGVSLLGMHSDFAVGARGAGVYQGTTILCDTNADAGLVFGAVGTTSYGGFMQDISVDGGEVADYPIWIGRRVNAMFQSVTVSRAREACWGIFEAQNCALMLCGSNASPNANAIEIDLGAGGNGFFKCEFNGFNEYGVYIHQSEIVAPGASVYESPQDNRFWSCLIERVEDTNLAVVYQGAGERNSFYGCTMSAVNSAPSSALVWVNKDTDAPHSHQLTLDNCTLYGSAYNDADGIRVGSGCGINIGGNTIIRSVDYAFVLDDATPIVSVESIDYQNINHTVNSTTFANTAMRLIFEFPVFRRGLTATASGLVCTVWGETANRFVLDASGTMTWGAGSGAADNYLSRNAAAQMVTGSTFIALDGVATKTKAGVPADGDFATTPPDGTMVLDTTNHRLYVRDGGSWKYAALT